MIVLNSTLALEQAWRSNIWFISLMLVLVSVGTSARKQAASAEQELPLSPLDSFLLIPFNLEKRSASSTNPSTCHHLGKKGPIRLLSEDSKVVNKGKMKFIFPDTLSVRWWEQRTRDNTGDVQLRWHSFHQSALVLTVQKIPFPCTIISPPSHTCIQRIPSSPR